jgi:hypothetical protein
MWRKKLVQKEAGTTPRHFGAAAKAVEEERARAARRSGEEPRVPVAAANVPPRVEAPQGAVFARSFSDPARETTKVVELYDKLVEVRTEAGEKSAIPSLKDFEKFVRQKTQELKDKGGHEVEYSVSVEGGRVKLKARISS